MEIDIKQPVYPDNQRREKCLKLCPNIMESNIEQPTYCDNQIREECLKISPIYNWNLEDKLKSIDTFFTQLAGLKKQFDQAQQMISTLLGCMENIPFGRRHEEQLDQLFDPLIKQIKNSVPNYETNRITKHIDKIKQHLAQCDREQEWHVQAFHSYLLRLDAWTSDLLNKKNILEHQENQNMRINLLDLQKTMEEYKKAKGQRQNYQFEAFDSLSNHNVKHQKRKLSLDNQTIQFIKGIQLKKNNKYKSEGEPLGFKWHQIQNTITTYSIIKKNSFKSGQQNYVYE